MLFIIMHIMQYNAYYGPTTSCVKSMNILAILLCACTQTNPKYSACMGPLLPVSNPWTSWPSCWVYAPKQTQSTLHVWAHYFLCQIHKYTIYNTCATLVRSVTYSTNRPEQKVEIASVLNINFNVNINTFLKIKNMIISSINLKLFEIKIWLPHYWRAHASRFAYIYQHQKFRVNSIGVFPVVERQG